ncbi:MAG: N-acetyltransferase [Bacteroidetes bacterium]|nr:MAG: N-acetyltransferase [Bacteroidota bacterium]
MDNRKITIRQTSNSDLEDVLDINRQAFGEEDVAGLVDGLLKDATAQPLLSLLALIEDKPAGYILFTRATLEGQTDQPGIQILAPLAIKPEFQKQGIGGKLIEEGISQLKKSGTELVFVLGHETYYPRHGFIPDAKSMGFPATYPIPEKNKDAWMIYPLVKDALNGTSGKVICADFMNRPEYWRE